MYILKHLPSAAWDVLTLENLQNGKTRRKYETPSSFQSVTHRNPDSLQESTALLTYSMEQSPSWEANWFCS